MKCDDCKYSDITRIQLGRQDIYFNEIYCSNKEKKTNEGFFKDIEIIKCICYEKEK